MREHLCSVSERVLPAVSPCRSNGSTSASERLLWTPSR